MNKYKISSGPEYPTDCTLILTNTERMISKEYLIESGAWQILTAFYKRKYMSLPDAAGDVIWFKCNDDMVGTSNG